LTRAQLVIYNQSVCQVKRNNTIMGRRSTVNKNRVYIECADTHRKVKGVILSLNRLMLKVELPTGFVLELFRRDDRSSHYKMQVGLLEFTSDGKPIP
jgi:hypothetical protein